MGANRGRMCEWKDRQSEAKSQICIIYAARCVTLFPHKQITVTRAVTDETHNGSRDSLPAAKRNIVRLKDAPWIKGGAGVITCKRPRSPISAPPTPTPPPSILPTLHRELGREFNPASHRGRDNTRREKKQKQNKGADHVSNLNCLHSRTLPAKQDNGQIEGSGWLGGNAG